MSVGTNGNGVFIKIGAISESAKSQIQSLANSIDETTKKLDRLVASIEAYSKAVGKNNGSTSRQMKKFADDVEKAQKQVEKLSNSLNKVNSKNAKLGNKISNMGENTKNGISKMLGQISNMQKIDISLTKIIGKAYAVINTAKMIGSAFGSSVRYAMDWYETENLYVQAMKGLAGEGRKWVARMAENYGLATAQLMQYQATFKNMISSLGGIDDEVAFNLSKTITNMSLDYASLFNFSFEQSMEKFQSALSQQTKAIRDRSGFDITKNTLQNALDMAGIDLSYEKLSIVEKRLAIILAIQQQLASSGAMGDFARTIEQPSNQLRILKQQLIEVSTWIGRLVLQYVAPAIKYLVAFAIVIKNVLKALATLLGYKGQSTSGKTDLLSEVTSNAESATSGVDKTGKAVEKLKRKLAGFDEMTIIGEKSNQGNSDLGGAGGINPKLLEAISNYESPLDKISKKTNDIVEKVMTWLGFTKFVDEETGEISWKLKDGETNLMKIIDAVKLLGTLLLGLYIGAQLINGFISVMQWVKSIGGALETWGKLTASDGALGMFGTWLKSSTVLFGGLSAPVWLIIAAILILVGAFTQLYIQSESFRNTVNNALQKIWDLLKSIGEAIMIFLDPIIEGAIELWNGFVKFLEPFFTILIDIFGVVVDVIKVIIEYLTPVLSVLGEIIGLILKVVGYLLGALGSAILSVYNHFKGLLTPVSEVWNAIKEWVRDFKENGVKQIQKCFDGIGDHFRKVFDDIKNFAKSIWDSITGFFKPENLVNSISSINVFGWKPFGGKTFFADGGFPQRGQMFVANEAGAELVGNIGGRTAVASNDMIVNAIYNAVYSAMSNAGNKQNTGDTRVYLGIKDVTREVVKEINATIKRTGQSPILDY